jgi:heme A synthase
MPNIGKMTAVRACASFLRYCWVLPVSCIGIVLIFLVIASGGTVRIAAGVLEAEGGMLRWLLSHIRRQFTIEAVTIGHVILSRNRESLLRFRDHERVHVRQYERWGLLFPFLYFLSSVTALVRGRDPYRDNRFEQAAFRASHDR